ncbi:hypothetical protein P8C59_005333 [Phyllachora maydis]|uniref:Uncharacterized protein n=1 Tax=Phyllachora maydis TaxID=1825666 RepID=A0AAD9I4G9_9PEZI|nr:hypothetical protein P8C59_005333 [Phyllachora maydis]
MHLLRRSCRMEGRNGPGGTLADKNKDDAYNGAYKPPTNVEEEEGNKDNSKGEEEEDNSNNNSISNSTSNSKDKAGRKPGDSSSYYKVPLV